MKDQSVLVNVQAGAISGFLNCVLLQPLDLIKTRIQQSPTSSTRNAHQNKISSVVRQVITTEGGFSSLWRGTMPSILRTVPGTTLYFAIMTSLQNYQSHNKYQALNLLFTGSFARVSAGFILMPMTVLKTRYESSLYGQYKSIPSAIIHMFRKEGLRSLFSGYGSTALRDAPYAGLYLYFYQTLKRQMPSNSNAQDANLSKITGNLMASSTAGLISTILTHPFDVIRVRIQLEPSIYKNSFQASKLILVNDGPKGFMNGLMPRLLRKTMSSMITWTLFEHLVFYLSAGRYSS